MLASGFSRLTVLTHVKSNRSSFGRQLWGAKEAVSNEAIDTISQQLGIAVTIFSAEKGEFKRILTTINNPDASVGVCCSHKVVAVGFNTLMLDAERSSKLYIRV